MNRILNPSRVTRTLAVAAALLLGSAHASETGGGDPPLFCKVWLCSSK
ncbi:hypothetical protein [uncultured Deinococcus sp.]|nr:hypothetical protein [uncultured Deinococcus sp.]